jgi:excisionase family DNA binding protein
VREGSEVVGVEAGRTDAGGGEAQPPRVVALTERLALSVQEAGELLGISRDLAYDLVARRELPSVRLGRRLVVPRRALEEALDHLLDAG